MTIGPELVLLPDSSMFGRIGPHDLSCCCPDCLFDFCSFGDEQIEEMFEIRYPFGIWLAPYSYPTPPNSPTNQEMHAYNGNLAHQHHHGVGAFVRAAGRGLARGAQPEDRFAAGVLGQVGLINGIGAALGMRELAPHWNEIKNSFRTRIVPGDKLPMNNSPPIPGEKPLKKKDKQTRDQDLILHTITHNDDLAQRDEYFEHRNDPYWDGGRPPVLSGPTNSDMHSYNGNQDNSDPYWDGGRPGGSSTEWQDAGTNSNGTAWQSRTHTHPDGTTDTQWRRTPQSTNSQPANAPSIPTGPSNGDMHSYNGNIQPMRPYTKKFAEKMAKKALKRKIKRKANKGKKKGIVINNNFGTKKGIAKGFKKKSGLLRKDSQEKRLALAYARFLRSPNFRAPRLGSSSTAETKILHGFYEATFSMASPGVGTLNTITNCTDLIVYLSPKMFNSGTTITSTGPVNVGFAVNSTNLFTAGASSFYMPGFANNTALQNESGATSAGGNVPIARFLGGHVSIICRCPMAATAPPFLFAGLLASNEAMNNSNYADPAFQINTLSSTSIRAMQSTKEQAGFEASAVYVPGSAKNLDFTTGPCTYNTATTMDITPIPYVGMSGCPTTANVTILVSGFFEIQQNIANMNYSGFARGPKISTEDIFDYLPEITPSQPKALSLGRKNNGGSAAGVKAMQQLMRQENEPIAKVQNIKNELHQLVNRIKELQIYIPDDNDSDDEKYFEKDTTIANSPIYKNLSKSTIDLALSIKDKLTPGSVTSKTVRSSLQ